LNGDFLKSSIKKFKIISNYCIFEISSIATAQEILTGSADFTSLDAFRCIDQTFLGYITIET